MEFKSQSGTHYWFDNKIGISFPVNSFLKIYFIHGSQDIISTVDHFSEDDLLFNAKFIKKLEMLRHASCNGRTNRIGEDEVKKYVLKYGLLQLTLGVTEDCNLACKYCIYSDAYANTRSSSKKRMDFTTAKRALDYYVSLLEEGKRYNPLRKFTIGFYGGEPLLNFRMIKKCVQYMKKTYPEIDPSYSITTNGTLLVKDKAAFLMEHSFAIAVSIDGPQEEHDRNRMYRNGNGTFSDVMKNVKRIMDTGYDKIHALAVFDWKSDLFKLQDFFNRPEIPTLSTVSTPSLNNGCQYYNQFSREDQQKFMQAESEAFEWYLDNGKYNPEKRSFFDHIFGVNAGRRLLSTPVLTDKNFFLIPYTGACVPGRKFFVDIYGNYHVCERVNETLPIGNIQAGLDFQRIADLLNDYISHLDICGTCGIEKSCGYCFCAFEKKGEFGNASKVCMNAESDANKGYSRAFTIGERDPQLLGMLAEDYYSMLSKISTTMGD